MAANRQKRNVKLIFPSTITTFSMVLGLFAILWAADNRIVQACYLLMIAIIMDGLDGKVARMTNTASEFGIQYDSLSDLVAFGVAPSVIFTRYFLYKQADQVYYLLPIMFLICGAIRLARFNVTASIYGKTHFTGLPIPAAAFMVAIWPPFLVWAARSTLVKGMGLTEVLAKENVFEFCVGLVIALSWSMISTIKFDTPTGFWLRKFRYKPLNYAVILAFFTLIFIHFTVFFLAISAYYLLMMYGRVVFDKIRRTEDLPRLAEG